MQAWPTCALLNPVFLVFSMVLCTQWVLRGYLASEQITGMLGSLESLQRSLRGAEGVVGGM